MSSGFLENEIRISKAAYPRRRCYFYAALFVDKLRTRKGERLEKWGEIVLKVYIFFASPPASIDISKCFLYNEKERSGSLSKNWEAAAALLKSVAQRRKKPYRNVCKCDASTLCGDTADGAAFRRRNCTRADARPAGKIKKNNGGISS